VCLQSVAGLAGSRVVTGIKRVNISVGLKEAGCINLALRLSQPGGLQIKRWQRCVIAGVVSAQHALLQIRHGIYFPVNRRATHSWKQYVGTSITGENLPPS